jgi:hypothetical protein
VEDATSEGYNHESGGGRWGVEEVATGVELGGGWGHRICDGSLALWWRRSGAWEAAGARRPGVEGDGGRR